MRRARTTTRTGVIYDRYMCPRTVEAPGACARGSGVEKSRTVQWRAQRPCSGGRPAPRYEMGTSGVPGVPRCKLSRWPAV